MPTSTSRFPCRERVYLFACACSVLLAAGSRPMRADETPSESPAAAPQESTYRTERNVVYSSPGGDDLLLDAYLPDGDGPHPAILVVHGGAWRSGGKGQLAGYARTLARRGYAAFAINYRLAPKHKFPAQLEDCQAAVRWIRKHAATYRIDPRRVGGVGYSAGGHLVALLGVLSAGSKDDAQTAKAPDEDTSLQAVCAGGAPCDFRDLPAQSLALAFWLGGPRVRLPDRYEAASPAAFISEHAPPMFFFHGSEDDLVPASSPRNMVNALRALGVPCDLHFVEKAGHIATCFNGPCLTKCCDFFDEHLRGGTVPPPDAAGSSD
ncbi:MAG TPA: alpha/beta hydrolase [Planctomycetaceae bacterium]|nr:alpha/beta hydrolase [Planctomycetaceae bacterium]